MNLEMLNAQPSADIFRVGKVVAVHPRDHSVDVVLLEDGTRLGGVQVMSPSAGTRVGRVDLPVPDRPPGDDWSLAMTKTHDLLAVVAMTQYFHFVLGFIYPQVNELAMPDDDDELKDLQIERHASDFVTTIMKDAKHSQHHPSGAYMTIGGLAPPDLENRDFDRKWRIRKNKQQSSNLITIRARIIRLLGRVLFGPYGNWTHPSNVLIDHNGRRTHVTVGDLAVTGGWDGENGDTMATPTTYNLLIGQDIAEINVTNVVMTAARIDLN